MCFSGQNWEEGLSIKKTRLKLSRCLHAHYILLELEGPRPPGKIRLCLKPEELHARMPRPSISLGTSLLLEYYSMLALSLVL